MSKYVLDASALFTYLRQETGWKKVESLLENSQISAINYAEFLAKCVDRGAPLESVIMEFKKLEIPVTPFDETQSEISASLRPLSKKYELSLGDRCCIALGLARKCTVVTADKIWTKIPNAGKIEVIR